MEGETFLGKLLFCCEDSMLESDSLEFSLRALNVCVSGCEAAESGVLLDISPSFIAFLEESTDTKEVFGLLRFM